MISMKIGFKATTKDHFRLLLRLAKLIRLASEAQIRRMVEILEQE